MPKMILGKDDFIEIRWHGRGGQGVVTASKLLADVALQKGLYFQAFPDYGPERMGAPIRAFTRLSNHPINIHSQVTNPDIVIVLDPTVMETTNITEGLSEEGILIINTPGAPKQIRDRLKWRSGRVFTLNASEIAIKHLGREITNTPMLGALSRTLKAFSPDDLAEAISEKFDPKFGKETTQKNINALNEAATQLQEG